MYTYYSLLSLAASNRPIDRALLKHGFSNFKLEILEYCSKQDVITREQYYLDKLRHAPQNIILFGYALRDQHWATNMELGG
jgi:group I intron endonuclease